MKKNVEWLKGELGRIARYSSNEETIVLSKKSMFDLINQLDEPEVLSQEWIDEHKRVEGQFFVEYEVVPVKDLQNLLVPKQEEQSTETVADVVTTFWKSYDRLKEVMSMEVEEEDENE